jgi:hypothetical protein
VQTGTSIIRAAEPTKELIEKPASRGAARDRGSSKAVVDRRSATVDSAEALLTNGDYTGAWLRATRANDKDLVRRIVDACRSDSVIAARRNVTVGCPH